jgi:hypothetical protein
VEANLAGKPSDEGRRDAPQAIFEDRSGPAGIQAPVVGCTAKWIESAAGGNQKAGSSNLSGGTIFSLYSFIARTRHALLGGASTPGPGCLLVGVSFLIVTKFYRTLSCIVVGSGHGQLRLAFLCP